MRQLKNILHNIFLRKMAEFMEQHNISTAEELFEALGKDNQNGGNGKNIRQNSKAALQTGCIGRSKRCSITLYPRLTSSLNGK